MRIIEKIANIIFNAIMASMIISIYFEVNGLEKSRWYIFTILLVSVAIGIKQK